LTTGNGISVTASPAITTGNGIFPTGDPSDCLSAESGEACAVRVFNHGFCRVRVSPRCPP
jgi:hypothetical protein